MKLSLLSLVAVAAMSVGCAANPGLQSQVDSLQKESDLQNAKIRELSADAIKCQSGQAAGDLGTDAKVLATASWAWLTATASDATTASEKIAHCYSASSDSVHTFEQARILMQHCYDQK